MVKRYKKVRAFDILDQ